jgi:phospholipid/cholesterol/gamma-HCH transport system ATP-binding protein
MLPNRTSTPAPGCVIEVEDLWTRAGGHTIHEGLSLCVRRGELLSVIGGSGAGKTVLLRHLLGLQHPARGRVRVFGQDLQAADRAALDAVRRRWGVLFQGGALFSALDVHENVALPLRELRALDEDVISDLVRLKLELVGLSPADARKRPAELSGGMVKRAALARALALDPELLLVDEPTSGLDPVSAAGFQELVRKLRARLRLTVVMVTHDVDTLAALSDRVAVLAEGRIVALGSLDEVRRASHPFVQQYFARFAPA